MKYIKKALIIFLTFVFTLATSACGNNDKSWALKYENNTVSNGVYVYFLWVSYSNALQQLSAESDSMPDIKTQKIDGKVAEVWIKESAIKYVKEMLATEKLFEEKGLTISDEESKKIDEETSASYENLKEKLEKYKITLDDFKRAYALLSIKSEKLFKGLYGKDGSEAVSDEDLLNYYKTNYVSLNIIAKNSESSPESDENAQNNENTNSDEKTEEQFKNYVNMINNGEKSLTDVGNMFKESEKIDHDPIETEVLNPNSDNVSKEISSKINELELNKSTYLKFKGTFLLLFKNDINKSLPNMSDEKERAQILLEMKSSDFKNLLKSEVEKMNIKVNENSIKDYPPATFFKED